MLEYVRKLGSRRRAEIYLAVGSLGMAEAESKQQPSVVTLEPVVGFGVAFLLNFNVRQALYTLQA